jgi:hypothetical protein
MDRRSVAVAHVTVRAVRGDYRPSEDPHHAVLPLGAASVVLAAVSVVFGASSQAGSVLDASKVNSDWYGWGQGEPWVRNSWIGADRSRCL